MYDFYKENADSVNAFIVVIILCICGVWFTLDYHRNEPVYNNTDNTMEQLESRVSDIERRVNRMSERIAAAEKTVTGIAERVNASAGYAHQIADGIGGVETRIDAAVQRCGRIQNLITEIERTNQ